MLYLGAIQSFPIGRRDIRLWMPWYEPQIVWQCRGVSLAPSLHNDTLTKALLRPNRTRPCVTLVTHYRGLAYRQDLVPRTPGCVKYPVWCARKFHLATYLTSTLNLFKGQLVGPTRADESIMSPFSNFLGSPNNVTTKKTDKERRLKLIKSYAPDWCVSRVIS